MKKKIYDKIQKKWTNFRLDENSVFIIGAGGMRPVDDTMLVIPNTVYRLGASSSPDPILVTKINDDFIYYHKLISFDGNKPYTKLLSIERDIGLDLIKTGCETWIKNYGSYFPKVKKMYLSNIQGKKSPDNGKDKLKDWDYSFVTCVGTKKTKDLYGSTKSYGVLTQFTGDNAGEGGTTIIKVRNYVIPDMKKDNNFKITKISKKE